MKRTLLGVPVAIVGLAAVIAMVSVLAFTQTSTDEPAYAPRGTLADGDEIVLVYIGASSCAACLSDEIKEDVRRLKAQYHTLATRADKAFSTIGVSIDWDISEGMDLLEGYGDFDEISVGRNWQNSLARVLVWEDYPGRPAIPQALVLERRVRADAGGIRVSNEQLLRRLVGVEEIATLVDSIAAVPTN